MRTLYIVLPALVSASSFGDGDLNAGIAAFDAKNGLKAIEILRPLAIKGSGKAQFYLGQIYWEGPSLFPGVTLDKELGWSWIKKSADGGFGEAEYFIGASYLLGLDQPKDDEAAVVWIRKAATHGYAPAMGVMGNACWGGDSLVGVQRDPKAAMAWFKKAARMAESHSMFMIARMYTVGAGVPQDYVEAHAWMNLAAAHSQYSSEYNADLRESLARKMTSAQVAKAQARAKSLTKELGLEKE